MNKLNKLLIIVIVLLWGVWGCTPRTSVENIREEILKENLPYKIIQLFISPNGESVAYMAIEGNKRYAFLGGKKYTLIGESKGDNYVQIGFLKISPDFKTIAYWARRIREKKECIVLGDTEGKWYDHAGEPVFSPDGKTIAYSAEEYGNHFIVVGDEEGKAYDYVWAPVFSSNGETIAYRAVLDRKQFMVVGKKEGKQYDYVSPPVFSSGGDVIAYRARIRDKECIVHGGREGKWYDHRGESGVSNIIFSLDGKSTAYQAHERLGGLLREFVVHGEKEGKRYSDVRSIIFSPDGQKVAYKASLYPGGKHFIVVGEKEWKQRYEPHIYAFSPSGNILAYSLKKKEEVTYRGEGLEFKDTIEKKCVVFGLNGKKGQWYAGVDNVTFSPDGKTLVYRAGIFTRMDRNLIVIARQNTGHEEVSGFLEVSEPVFIDDLRIRYFGYALGKLYKVTARLREPKE
ncbi:MAG: hypothetical protein GTO45_13185 [Candidatus Aminicenantes bacterium]|nr:hypothetical protein [Candidatus Aminicenantes bacterium]NIM79728.1 hypothetical protein [Candidatus Aminicenantes bacterium]NIN19059.1 hypothetical protein [Candidatus Aminicenantes bacterium]NIN42961.1 hypothetical protein [Candidatus Aminicenantes bacterium]NIN85704.1 hypothetical protein [Candidatus Aminicenantes bacterium]